MEYHKNYEDDSLSKQLMLYRHILVTDAICWGSVDDAVLHRQHSAFPQMMDHMARNQSTATEAPRPPLKSRRQK